MYSIKNEGFYMYTSVPSVDQFDDNTLFSTFFSASGTTAVSLGTTTSTQEVKGVDITTYYQDYGFGSRWRELDGNSLSLDGYTMTGHQQFRIPQSEKTSAEMAAT